MNRNFIAFAVLVSLGTMASAQPRRPAPPQLSPIELLRADFASQSGASIVYFPTGSSQLSPQALQVLVAQARWIRQHPDAVVRIEGNADGGDTRDHALAVGARRAQEVRDYLILLGVPSTQVSAMSWGKEHPGPGRAATVIVQ